MAEEQSGTGRDQHTAGADSAGELGQPTEPLDVDGVSAFAVGTVLWAIAGVVLLIGGTERWGQDGGWWLWVCVVGIVIGALALTYSLRRRAVYRAAKQGAASG